MDDAQPTRREAIRTALTVAAVLPGAAALAGPDDARRRDTWYPAPPDASTPRLLLPGWLGQDGVLVRFEGGPVGPVRSHTWEVDRQSHNETLVDLPGAKPGRLLVWCQGYAVYAGDLTAGQITGPQPIRLPMKPLPRTTLAGRLLDSEGQPVGGRHLALTYRLDEQMPFFGVHRRPGGRGEAGHRPDQGRRVLPPAGGRPVCRLVPGQGSLAPLPRVRRRIGQAAPAAPRPSRPEPPRRALEMALGEVGDITRVLSSAGYVEGVTLPAASKYPAAVPLRLRYPGTLYGRVTAAYLKKIGLSEAPGRYLEWEAGRNERLVLSLSEPSTPFRGGRYLYPRPDGGLSEAIPVGTYRVEVHLTGEAGRTLAVLHDRLEVTERRRSGWTSDDDARPCAARP
jgi:hypothetical protein